MDASSSVLHDLRCVPGSQAWRSRCWSSAIGSSFRLTAHINVFPTLAELCHLKIDRDLAWDGARLAPLLLRRRVEWPSRTVVTDSHRLPFLVKGKRCAAMTDDWRLLGPLAGKKLYRIKEDPAQREDVSAKHPDVVKRLQQDYETWWKHTKRRADESVLRPNQINEATSDDEDVHQTRRGHGRGGPPRESRHGGRGVPQRVAQGRARMGGAGVLGESAPGLARCEGPARVLQERRQPRRSKVFAEVRYRVKVGEQGGKMKLLPKLAADMAHRTALHCRSSEATLHRANLSGELHPPRQRPPSHINGPRT